MLMILQLFDSPFFNYIAIFGATHDLEIAAHRPTFVLLLPLHVPAESEVWVLVIFSSPHHSRLFPQLAMPAALPQSVKGTMAHCCHLCPQVT